MLAVLAVAGGLLWREAGRSDPVPEAEVIDDLREDGVAATNGGPKPGVYRLRVAGDEDGGAGPIRVSRELPAEGTVAVSGTDDGWEVLTTYSRQHIEAARYRRDGDAVRMTWRRVDVTFGIGRDDRRDIEGVARLVPAIDPAPGTRWADRYTTGSLVNTVENRVLRRDRLVIGGDAVDTVVIASTTTTTGALAGTRRETLWWSPVHRLVVRSELDVDIGGAFGYRSRITSELVGLVPAT